MRAARLLRAACEARPPLLADRGETAIVCVLNSVPRRFAGARVKDTTLRVEGRSDIAEYMHGTVTVAVRSITRSSSARIVRQPSSPFQPPPLRT
jgi:hypothetical protein